MRVDDGKHAGFLRSVLSDDGIKILSEPIKATYNGPFTPSFLRKNRKISLVVVLSLSAIITPPDIASQIIVSIPILILYEVSILISRIVTRKQQNI